MGHRDGIIAIIALVLSSVAMAGIVYTDSYAQAAQSEAQGYHALTQVVVRNDAPARSSRLQPTTLLSMSSVAADGTAKQ